MDTPVLYLGKAGINKMYALLINRIEDKNKVKQLIKIIQREVLKKDWEYFTLEIKDGKLIIRKLEIKPTEQEVIININEVIQ